MTSPLLHFKVSLFRIACAAMLSSAISVVSSGAETQSFSYGNDFSAYGATAKAITSTATSANDYFSKNSEIGTWELINGRIKASWTGSSDGVSSFVKRDFRDGNLLSAGLYINNPSLTVTTYWSNGNSTDGFLWSYFGLLNASGQGYVAAVSRSGTIQFFEINTLSDTSSWTLLGSQDTSFRQGQSDKHSFTFSIQGNDLTLTNTKLAGSTNASFSVILSSLKYSEFTTITLGGKFGTGSSGSNFNPNFDDLLVTGTLANTVVPEPSSIALLFGGIALAAIALSRRRRR
ncbi:PEP-CTERM sorting domain-containing protein [Geminisphaera colitermitum]|uniref:PEP-CTERM sorting domain-containing protein n=1 Tax=Geminisphaera colitermitum TaxID=1148786 RepID=UPI000158D3E3|nr:PEP-CTERM sorting domain-containing protein [Geminisphaera colitermitum]